MTLDLYSTPPPEDCIFSTRQCFDDALDFLTAVLVANPQDAPELRRSLKLVHGICLAPDGQPYAHAWVEDDRTGQCIFRGIQQGALHYFGAPRADYYAELRVQERTRYSLRAAAQHNRQYGTYGPWLPKYRALCGTGAQAPEPSL
jgi:hypothetical protein